MAGINTINLLFTVQNHGTIVERVSVPVFNITNMGKSWLPLVGQFLLKLTVFFK